MLAVADNADGTGATATISGTSGGTNTVYAQPVTGGDAPGPWATAGTITGDGTLTLSLSPGFYFAYLLTDPATVSGPVYFRVSTDLEAVAQRCFAAVKNWLAMLDLPFTRRVYDYAFANDPSVTYPCTVLTTDGATESDEAALNGRDDWGHPVRVLIRDVVVEFDETKKPVFLGWRQAVGRAFQNQRLAGVPESVRNKVIPGALFRPAREIKTAKVAESELTIKCITREVRGLGA